MDNQLHGRQTSHIVRALLLQEEEHQVERQQLDQVGQKRDEQDQSTLESAQPEREEKGKSTLLET